MAVYLPGGPAAQLANLSFLLAALVSDVLLIRFFLVSAYIWLLICEQLWASPDDGLPDGVSPRLMADCLTEARRQFVTGWPKRHTELAPHPARPASY